MINSNFKLKFFSIVRNAVWHINDFIFKEKINKWCLADVKENRG